MSSTTFTALRNTVTPRVFVAATRMNDGKTTTCLGLLSALQRVFPRLGYIKPVGQRFVEVEEQKIDEDTVLMNQVYDLKAPLVDMSPIAVEPDFTRRYLQASNHEALVRKIQKAFDRVAWETDFVLAEGSGHAGVGSVFDLSNAAVARVLGCKAVIVTQGGIGRPIDEVCLNRALFEDEGVEVIGVILNKVLFDKVDYVTDFARRGFKRKGLELLGVIPHQPVLSSPTLAAIHEELDAELLNTPSDMHGVVSSVVVAAMSVHNALRRFAEGALLILPGDREDILLAAAAACGKPDHPGLAGIILTDAMRPPESVLRLIREMRFPVLLAEPETYVVASRVHDLIVKTRPTDVQKIRLIRDIIARHVDVARLVEKIR
ncbi:MAG: phosphotransacetylase family protein [Limisphaerales bacterium]